MLRRIDARELTEWAAYERVSGPLDGAWRGDRQAAIVAATVANAMRGRRGRRAKPADFMPQWDRQAVGTTGQSGQDHLRIVTQANAAMGGRREGGGVGGDIGRPTGEGGRRRQRRAARQP